MNLPYFIFIADRGRLTIESLLDRLGAEPKLAPLDYVQLRELGRTAIDWRYVVTAETAAWKLVIDDWMADLWIRPETRTVIEGLAADFDVMLFNDGESDASHEFRLYRNAELVRELIVDCPMFGAVPDVLVDDGPPVDGEVDVERRMAVGIRNNFLEVAARNGFDLEDGIENLKLWQLEPMTAFAARRKASGYDIDWETERRTASWSAIPTIA